MLRNYLKTAIRNLWRQKGNTFLNLSGLTIGIASSLILFLLIRHMSSFDNFHTKRDRIFRVVTESDGNDGKDHTSGVPGVLHTAFRNDMPEAEYVIFTSYDNGGLVTIPQSSGEPKRIQEENGIVYTQQNFFKMFDRKIVEGDAVSTLDKPNEAIVSKKIAAKYFGDQNALGQVIRYGDKDYKISAVMEDYPSNTDFPFNLMLSYVTVQAERDKERGWNSIWSDDHCYFLLREGESVEKIRARMPEFGKKYLGEDSDKQGFLIQPLAEMHYDDRFGNYTYNTVSRGMLSILGVIALFLIITACINFINLSTAEAIKRSKEVGIRKSLGSSRQQLIAQFLGEAILVTSVAMFFALGVTGLGLTFLNPFLKTELALDFSGDSGLWIFIVLISVIVSLLSGLYPSFVVSNFSPVAALKNTLGNKNSSSFNLRRALVVVQFSISQFFIIGTIILIAQMNYFQSKDLGFNKDAIVTVPIPVRETPSNDGSSKMKTLREEVIRLNGVQLATLCNTPPSSGSVSGTGFKMEGSDTDYGTQLKLIDNNYINLFGLNLVAGENLQDSDTAQSVLVNEKLANMVGYANAGDIVGKTVRIWQRNLPVRGVIKNFHTVSLHQPIEATILFSRLSNYRRMSIKINPQDMQSTLSAIQKKWEAAYPEHIYSYEFLDNQIAEFYETEKRTSVLLTIFTSIAIFIGCLGLFGLASFMANQKTKEIGVRKVLGASVESIVMMFSMEYVKLIIVGFIIASPIAWYVMNKWLNGFAYKIEIGPLIFVIGIGVTLVIALFTVGYRSLKAAVVNPAQSLRSE